MNKTNKVLLSADLLVGNGITQTLNLMLPSVKPLLVEMSKKPHEEETKSVKYKIEFLVRAMIAAPISILCKQIILK